MTTIQDVFGAIRRHDTRYLTECLERGVSPNAVNDQGVSLLSAALNVEDKRIVLILLKKGATAPELKDPIVKKIFTWAVQNDSAFLAVGILRNRENPNCIKTIPGPFNETILHEASRVGDAEFIQFVLDQHLVDPNAANEGGQTALHYAALKGHTAAIRILRSHINPNVEDRQGQTALHYLAKDGQVEAIQALLGK